MWFIHVGGVNNACLFLFKKSQLSEAYNHLQEEHNQIQNSYSEEMLQSAKLRGQLEELQVLKTQNTL